MSARNSWSFFFPLIVQTLNLRKDMLALNGCSMLSPINIDEIISILSWLPAAVGESKTALLQTGLDRAVEIKPKAYQPLIYN